MVIYGLTRKGDIYYIYLSEDTCFGCENERKYLFRVYSTVVGPNEVKILE